MATTLAYLLHTRPWRETSLLADALTQDFGRITLIVKGAKRPHSPLRGLLEPFVPVRIQFTGKLGIKQLSHAHWVQALNPIHPSHTLHAWYLSELCLRALGEDDPMPIVFFAYHRAIQALAMISPDENAQGLLRQFEHQLLLALGLWPDAKVDALGQPLRAQAAYAFSESLGWSEMAVDTAKWCLSGEQILRLSGFELADDDALQQPAKNKQDLNYSLRYAMRMMLLPALHGKNLLTREVWKGLDSLSPSMPAQT
jgi:DNA repair protein RecO (recombination protein O)